MAELVGLLIYRFSPSLIAAFNRDPQVIAFGMAEAHNNALFYFLLAFSHCIAGILGGAGEIHRPHGGHAAVLVYRARDLHHHQRPLYPGYPHGVLGLPLTWTLSSIVFLVYFLKGKWVHGFEQQVR